MQSSSCVRFSKVYEIFLIVGIFVSVSIFMRDKNKGLLPLILSKPINRTKYLLSKLLFDKRNIKIDVTPISEAQYKTAGYPSWRKYVVNVHVDPFKFNNVTDEYSEEYYDFMIEVEDIISDSVKYIGTDSYELGRVVSAALEKYAGVNGR